MRTRTRLLTAAAVLVALTGTAGATIANADPTPGAGTATDRSTTAAEPADAGKPADRAGQKHRPLTARALHGSVTVGGQKEQRVLDFQRGTVSTVSATSVTVRSVDGFTATYAVEDSTRIRSQKKAGSIADIEATDEVRVVAQDGTAKVIRERAAR
jgi:hypothetical protein